MNHPNAIVGITIISKLLQCFAIYALGSSTPIANRPVASTMRMTSSVITFELPPQERGLNIFAQYGMVQ